MKKLVTLLAFTSIALQAQWITGHYAAQNGTMPVSAIPWSKYTHVVHFAAAPNADATIRMHYLSQAEINSLIAARPAGKKVIVCIKDNDYDSSAFMSATSPAKIAAFVSNVVTFVNSNQYDGVDFDWENNVSTAQYTDLINRVRAAMPAKLITIDSGNWNNLETVAGATYNLLDQINLMCYDMDGAANGYSWHNDALLQNGNSAVMTCDWRVRAFTNKGVPAAKIGIGLPYYGRRWTGVSLPLVSGNFAPTFVLYRDLVADTTRWKPQYQFYDSGYKASYLSIPSLNEFISYNGTQSITDAVAWQKSAGLGGFMTFTMDYEYITSQTGDAAHPLSTALYNAVNGTPAQAAGPVISGGSPTGTLSVLTTSATLSVATNVNATCRYGVTANTPYNSIANTFTLTGGTTHTALLAGLVAGSAKSYFVRCSDTAGNVDTADYVVSFSVTAAASGPSTMSVLPNTGTGASQVFTFNVADGNGAAAMQQIDAIFDTATGKANSCAVEYWAPTRTVFLKSDNNSSWAQAVIGTAGSLSNSQCSLNTGTSTAVSAGNTMTLSLSMTFAPSTFAGARSILFYASDLLGLNSGWQTLGAWIVPTPPPAGPPLTVLVSPNSGTGTAATFVLRLIDSNGASAVRQADFIAGNSYTYLSSSCFLDYWAPTNTVSLRNDTNTGWAGQGQIGSATVLKNNQCSLSLASASTGASGNTLTVTLPVTFIKGLAGMSRTLFASALDASGYTTGWQTVGTWIVR